jgi:hypothetical protein
MVATYYLTLKEWGKRNYETALLTWAACCMYGA